MSSDQLHALQRLALESGVFAALFGVVIILAFMFYRSKYFDPMITKYLKLMGLKNTESPSLDGVAVMLISLGIPMIVMAVTILFGIGYISDNIIALIY